MNAKKSALVIGIGQYPENELASPHHDAEDVAALLAMPEFGFDARLVLNADATRRRLYAELADLGSVNCEVALIYFAGHAIHTNAGAFLLSVDGDRVDPGLSLDAIARVARSANRPFVLILDCCYAGSFKQSEGDLLDQHGLRDISRKALAGVTMIGACGPSELAASPANERNSRFTATFIEGALGAAADSRGEVTLPLLFEHISAECERKNLPDPVILLDQTGRLVLGNPGMAAQDAVTAENQLHRIEDEAEAHLDDYLRRSTVSYQELQSDGYPKQARLLRPVLRWFDNQLVRHPALAMRTRFRLAHSSAQAFRGQLGILHPGLQLPEGPVVLESIDAGSFGTVWKCSTNAGSGFVAFKAFHAGELWIADKLKFFQRGHAAMQLLDHPRIVRVGAYSDCPVGFFMDFIDGGNLRSLTAFTFRDEPAAAVQFMIEIAETLEHAHGRGVIHRDLKPENIIVPFSKTQERWIPVLTDFDLAWYSTASFVTKEPFGALHYAAPEQQLDPGSAAVRRPTTDVFGFGQLCFFILSGRDPVDRESAELLRGSLTHWRDRSAAAKMRHLYTSCSEKDPRLRVQGLRTVSDELFEIQHRLKDTGNPNRLLAAQDFVRELESSLAGSFQRADATTISGRTSLRLSGVRTRRDRLSFSVMLQSRKWFDRPATPDLDRQMLEVLRYDVRVTMRQSRQGAYTALVFSDIKRNSQDLRTCREILVRIIDLMESV